MHTYYTYILASGAHALYVGMTRDLPRRLAEHRSLAHAGFTRAHRVLRLVYFEATENVRSAIAREKQLKRWPRWRKLRLIERANPAWRELSADWSPEGR